MKIAPFVFAIATAQVEHLSLLQTRASKRVSGEGLCGLGIFTKTEATEGATIADFLSEFTDKCEGSYDSILCKSLQTELFDGVNADAAVVDNPNVIGICQEISALILADVEHKALNARAQNHSLKDDAANLDEAVSSKDLRACDETDCNSHGTTDDADSSDGCDCQCVDGWSGADCSTEITTTTTVAAGKAVDDPHLTSIHGNHFDLYTSGKYTLLTVPKHASPKEADLLVDAYVEKIGERKNDLWIRRLTVGGKWVGERYSFKTSSGKFGSESTHLVRVGHGDWKSPEAAEKKGSAAFKVLATQDGDAPTTDFGQTSSKRVEVQCGPVTALVKWATVQKDGEDINHIDFRIQGLHNLSGDVGGLLADELDTDRDLSVSLLGKE